MLNLFEIISSFSFNQSRDYILYIIFAKYYFCIATISLRLPSSILSSHFPRKHHQSLERKSDTVILKEQHRHPRYAIHPKSSLTKGLYVGKSVDCHVESGEETSRLRDDSFGSLEKSLRAARYITRHERVAENTGVGGRLTQ